MSLSDMTCNGCGFALGFFKRRDFSQEETICQVKGRNQSGRVRIGRVVVVDTIAPVRLGTAKRLFLTELHANNSAITKLPDSTFWLVFAIARVTVPNQQQFLPLFSFFLFV